MMGVHLAFYTKAGEDVVPEGWDLGRLVGDREFSAMLGTLLPTEVYREYPDDEAMYRPVDIKVWREEIAKRPWPNPGRFEGLCDILEADPELWLFVSC